MTKLKSLYLHYRNIYGHKTKQYGDLPWLLFAHKIIWRYNHVVLWDHMTNLKHCVSTTIMLMATKYGWVMTYLAWRLPMKSHDHIIRWSCKIIWQTRIIMYRLTQCLWLSTLAGWRYTIRSFLPFTRSFNHVVLKGQVNHFSCCVTTVTRPMCTRLGGKVVTWYKELQPIKSHNPLSTCSRDKFYKISTLLQYPWLPNPAGWLRAIKSFLP